MQGRSLRFCVRPGLSLGLAVALLLAYPAGAIPLDVSISSTFDGVVVTEAGQYEANDYDGDGIFTWDLSALPSNIASTSRWDVTQWDGAFNPDPSISNGFSVTNLLAGVQTFTITVSSVTGPIGAPTTLTGGSAQGGVTDTNGNGATLSTTGAGSAFYTSLMDGGDWVSLYVDPDSVSAGAFLSNSFFPVEDFGTPIPSLAGPAVVSSIGIRFKFDLTGMDRGTGSGVFVVEPVPEPSTALLVAMGLGALALRRRSR